MRRRHLPFVLGLPLADGVGPAAGADGGRRDWFIFLESGRQTPDDAAAVQAMQRGHIDNFKRLFALGRLTGAGPLRDPAGLKRGIVVVRAASREELQGYFQPDDYVRDGYLRVNAVPATAHRPLRTEGIDASRVEELRIVQLARPAAPPDAGTAGTHRALLQGLVDRGVAGAWYSLDEGPVAEVLFAGTTADAPLADALAPWAQATGVVPAIWRQWLSPGVVPRAGHLQPDNAPR